MKYTFAIAALLANASAKQTMEQLFEELSMMELRD